MTTASPPTVLIAGASGTLGGAIARALLARGYCAGLHYHTQAQACEKIAAEFPSPLPEGGEAARRTACYAADFADPASPGNLAAAFLKDFGRIDALVWSAGIVRDAPVMSLSEDDARAVLNVNLKAFFLLLKAFSRQFIKQKSGAVLALSSHAGIAGRAGGASYAMAHSGMLALVKSAAREWGALGVRVNALLPPFVPESGMGRAASPEFAAAVKARRVLKAEFDGAAAVATFALSVLENPALSGQVLSVDSRV